MKIAISALGKASYDLLDVRFGRCEYFQIHDTENGEVKVIENMGKISEGGAGIGAAQQLIDEGIDVIITGKLGPNAFKIIEKSDINVYTSESISINQVLEKYKNKELTKLQTAGTAHSGMENGFRGGR